MIEPPEGLFDLAELFLGLGDYCLEAGQALFVVGLILGPCLVLVGAKVLNLLARVFDLCEAQCGAAAFEEMAEGAKLG